MIMPNLPIPANCPVCGSENVGTKWSHSTILAWVFRLFAIPVVKMFDKRCMVCGHEFQVFLK
jgi:transcription elongation factor Elf1